MGIKNLRNAYSYPVKSWESDIDLEELKAIFSKKKRKEVIGDKKKELEEEFEFEFEECRLFSTPYQEEKKETRIEFYALVLNKEDFIIFKRKTLKSLKLKELKNEGFFAINNDKEYMKKFYNKCSFAKRWCYPAKLQRKNWLILMKEKRDNLNQSIYEFIALDLEKDEIFHSWEVKDYDFQKRVENLRERVNNTNSSKSQEKSSPTLDEDCVERVKRMKQRLAQ